MVNKKADMRIQQMSFMILFVFIFFAVAGLFIAGIQSQKLKQNYIELERETTIKSLSTIADMPELNCESSKTLCLDEDKIYVLSSRIREYEEFWPVASIRVRKVFPKSSKEIICPAPNCTIYEIYNSGQSRVQEYGTFVSICKKIDNQGFTQEECGIGRLELGIKLNL